MPPRADSHYRRVRVRERNEDTSASISHDLYEGSNNVNSNFDNPKINSVKVDNTIDLNIPNQDFTSKKDNMVNSSELRESDPNNSIDESYTLNTTQATLL